MSTAFIYILKCLKVLHIKQEKGHDAFASYFIFSPVMQNPILLSTLFIYIELMTSLYGKWIYIKSNCSVLIILNQMNSVIKWMSCMPLPGPARTRVYRGTGRPELGTTISSTITMEQR